MSDFVMGATVRLNNDFSGKMSSMVADTEKFKASAASADRALENLDKSLKGVNGNGLSKIGTSATQAATAAKGVVAPIDNIVQSTNRAQNAIQSFNRGWQTVKALPSTLSNIGNALKNNVADGFTSAKLQASILAATVKTLGKQKLTGMVDGIKEFTDTITEGKSGIKGFATGLKNIGKISIASTVNAVKSLTDKAKEFAKVKISNIANSLKGLKSSFTDGKTGAAGLHTALKKVASVSLSALHSGISKIGSLAKSAGSAVASGLGKTITGTLRGVGVAVGALAAGTVAAGAGIFKMTNLASDLDETLNKVDVAFGAGNGAMEGSAAAVQEWSKTSIKSMGLAQQTALDTAALFGDMGTSMGLTKEAAADMSMALTQQAADLASFKNLNIEEVTTALNGVFTGETESLKRLGVVMTQTNLEAFAMAKGIGKTIDQMTEAEKVQLRYQYVMEKTANATGDFERTGGGFANQLRMFKEQLKQIGTSAGGIFKTGLTKGLVALNGFALEINNILSDGWQSGDDSKIADVFSRMIDKGISAISTGLPKVINTVVPIVNTLASSLLNAIVNVAPTLLNGATQIFNSLISTIQQNTPQIAQAATAIVSGLATFLLQAVPQLIAIGLDLIVGLAQGLTQGLPQILQQGVQSIVNFCNGITSRIPTIITTAIQLVQSLVQGLTQNLPQLIQSGVTMIASLQQGIWQMLPSILQSAIQLVMSLVQGVIQSLPLILQSGVQMVQSMVQGIVSMLPMIIQSAIQLIISLVQGLIQNLPMIIQSAVQIVVALAGGLIQAIPQLVAAIPQLIAAIVDTIMSTNWLQVGWDIVKGIGKGLLDGIKGIFGGGGEEGGAAVATGAASGMTSNLGTVTAATTQVSTTMTQGLQPDTAAVNAAGANTMTALASGITANAGVVNTSVAGIAPGITTTLNSSLATVDTSATASTIGTNITTGVTTGIQTGTAEVVSAATDMSTQAQTAIDTGMSNISTSFNSLDISGITTKCTEITQAFTEGMANANTAVSEGITAITSTLNAVNLYSCGVNIMQGLNNGLASMRGTIIATAQSIANSVKATINSALDIHSPSRVLEESGEFSGEGFANGLLNLVNKVKENAKTLANTAIEPFSVQRAATDITPSGPVTGGGGKVLSGLKVIIENLNLNDVANKDPKQLVAEILKELYAQLGGDDELLGSVDMGVLL